MTTVRAPGAWQVSRALARAEGRHLVSSPITLLGLALAVGGAAFFIWQVLIDSSGADWSDDGWTLHVGLFVLGLFVMVATNRAALRDRREATSEQHETLPAPRAARVGGLLLATIWPAAMGAVLMLGTGALVALELAVPGLEAIHSIQRIVVVAMFGVLGVALAVWIPQPFVASVVAFGLFAAAPPETPEPWHVIFPHALVDTFLLSFWHLAFFLGVTALFAAAALARGMAPRRTGVVIAASALTIGLSLAVLLSRVCPVGRSCLL